MRRGLIVIFWICLGGGALFAQMPRGFYAWWSSPVRKDLNLSRSQQEQIQSTVRGYSTRLVQLRAELDDAELDLEGQFNQDPLDPQKAERAIERLVTARSELTRVLSEMSLKLRMLLTDQQWQELQRRRPGRGQPAPAPEPRTP